MTNDYIKMQQAIASMAECAVNDWGRRQVRNLFAAMYLYYKPGEIAFYIGEEPLNDSWQLATPERISIAKSAAQVKRQIIDLAQRLPILSPTNS